MQFPSIPRSKFKKKRSSLIPEEFIKKKKKKKTESKVKKNSTTSWNNQRRKILLRCTKLKVAKLACKAGKEEVVGKTRKRDANDPPEQNRRSLKLVVKAFFIRVMLELVRSISRPSMVKHESLRSISITKIGIGEISMDRTYIYIFLSTPIVSFRIGIEYLSINRCDRRLKRIPRGAEN